MFAAAEHIVPVHPVFFFFFVFAAAVTYANAVFILLPYKLFVP